MSPEIAQIAVVRMQAVHDAQEVKQFPEDENSMSNNILLSAAAWVVLSSTGLAADLPKSGSIAGKFGWYGAGKVYEMEKGHIAFVGEFSGPFISDGGRGFLHGATVVCFGVNDVLFDGRESSSHGWCIATDAEGDKAFSVWKNKGGAMDRPGGENHWTGGTGKYAKLRGSNKFDTTVSPHGAGISTWHSGSYELN